jgi:voltage-gated potassium channel
LGVDGFDDLAVVDAWAVLMLGAVREPRQWLRDHPLEVAIVILTPSLLPASMQAARIFRLLRLLPLLRLGLITRRLLSTEGVRYAAVMAAMTILPGGAGLRGRREGPALVCLGRRLVGDRPRDDRRLR